MDFKETLRDDGITILKLAGRMDTEGTGKIDLEVTAATAVDGAYVVADLSDVSFMSSVGIGVLVRLTKAIRRRNGNLVLLSPQPFVRLVLEATGIPDVVSIHERLDEALTAVRAEQKRPS